jgi:DNA-binding CsgD family transcriptional regulator
VAELTTAQKQAFHHSVRRSVIELADAEELPLSVRQVDRLADTVVASMQAPEVTVPALPKGLTPMCREALHGIALGESAKQTAQRLVISEHTVKTHRRRLFATLGVKNGQQAVTVGVSLGLLKVSSSQGDRPVGGPIPVHVRVTPSGPALDMSALQRHIVTDIVEALLRPDDTDLWDRLHELAEPAAASDSKVPFEEFVADLAECTSSLVPLYGTAAVQLTRALRAAAAPKPVPSQREAGAA